ncbi:phosphate transporter [Klebsormidium nitens]|uniref:Phosphate transporter n=1 Tax=Klebsormidium nitens TaxID=105231 RepID=A0A1Y1HTV7_KLENI|nr:phosphate transporter [Klebsormidium nitens]|eukprot:GAQ81563.1 phosphate transporter [Klebsormidium nitens]
MAMEGSHMTKPVSKVAAVEEDDFETGEVASKQYSSNPLVAFVQWVLSFVVPGLGMFSEAYFIFSIGNVTSIFQKEYPKCWGTKSHPLCSSRLVAGIMAGMVFIGFFADRLGRKRGSILCASIMLLGAVMLIVSDGPDQKGILLMYTISQLVFGLGVGGEYPVASSSAAERAEADKALQDRRGETVVLTFSMQGVGNVANVIVLMILLAAFNQNGPTYDPTRLDWVWRLSFAVGLIPIFIMLYIRIFRLKESSIWQAKHNNMAKAGLNDSFTMHKFSLLMYHYWHRLLGTAVSWYVWDITFYGNKLFQGTFIKIIVGPNVGLLTTVEYTLLNAVIALVGYYFAAFTIDKRWMGRTRMQIMGFAWVFVLFLACAIWYSDLIKPAHIHVFQFLYYMSSFWGQWGPNSTTWLLPGEIFPTETRAFTHGMAAATGKAGALTAGLWFEHLSNQSRFYVCAICGAIGLSFTIVFVPDITGLDPREADTRKFFLNHKARNPRLAQGLVLTIVFVPDLTGLDLREADARWFMLVDGRSSEYVGEAIKPRHLSLWERIVGYGKVYDPSAPKLDLKTLSMEKKLAQKLQI